MYTSLRAAHQGDRCQEDDDGAPVVEPEHVVVDAHLVPLVEEAGNASKDEGEHGAGPVASACAPGGSAALDRLLAPLRRGGTGSRATKPRRAPIWPAGHTARFLLLLLAF